MWGRLEEYTETERGHNQEGVEYTKSTLNVGEGSRNFFFWGPILGKMIKFVLKWPKTKMFEVKNPLAVFRLLLLCT